MMTILSTREWATIIWVVLFFAFVLWNRECRKEIRDVIKLFFDPKLRILWEIILLYVLIITVIFFCSPLWENIYIKDSIIWFLCFGFIICMNSVSNEADEKYIKNVLKDNLKLTIFLEFIMSTFTFNIWIELAIIPIITIITVMNVMTERKEEYRTVHKLSDFVLAAAGFWILYETIKIGVNEYKELNALNTLVSFMIPIVYLILIIPLEYALELYSKYELLFVRMAFKEEKNKKVKRRRRISIIRACKLSVHRVLLFQREYYGKMYVTMKDEEFEQLMKDFRNTCKKRNDV